jgi:nitrile hydratase accessory protein
MNASEALTQLALAAKLDPGRAFSAPWEARAFAIAVKLAEAGVFTWPEFSELLIQEVAHGDASQSADWVEKSDHYEEHFLRALERVLEQKSDANKFHGR